MKRSILSICAAAAMASVSVGQAPAPAPATPANDKYVVNKTWAQIPADMPWNASTSTIAADGKGRVIVMVRAMPFFREFTRDGKFVRAWGDAALFSEPHSVMFDREGFIWATDAHTQQGHVVYKFDPNGKLLLTLGKKGVPGDNTSQDTFNRPNAVAIAPNGDIFVSDGYTNARVVQFTREGKFIRIFGGTKGAEPGQLQLPHGVALDSKGRVYVSDSDNKRISIFDKDGKFVETWAVPTRGNMLITADDTVYVSDVNTGSIAIVKNGQIVDTIPGLGRPHGITMDSDGTLYASDSTNRVVMKISLKK